MMYTWDFDLAPMLTADPPTTGPTRYRREDDMFTPSSFEALPRTHCAACGGLIIRGEESDWCPCLGGSCVGCGEQADGEFESGTHGPGYYCGWCDAVPGGRYSRGESMEALSSEVLEDIVRPHQQDYESIGGCVCGESYPCTTLGLVAEVRRLRTEVLAKCEQWDAEAPDAFAYVVTDSFRRLLDGDS